MASATGSTASGQALSHSISTVQPDSLPAATYSRAATEGSSVSGQARISAYKSEPCGDLQLPTQLVETYQQYMSGCREHDGCLGHFCTTPRGTILVPQRMATSLGTISNDYAKMAESIYNRDSHGQELNYRSKLRSMMFGKRGRMRGDMPAGVVDSSIRCVLSLCWEVSMGEIAVPRKLAENMRVLRVPTLLVDRQTGEIVSEETRGRPVYEMASAHYVEDKLREGDTMVIVRPPSLWSGNVQPMKVKLWEHECVGMSPSNTDEYHADHDGDEIQCYFIGTRTALDECSKWSPLNSDKFALTTVQHLLPSQVRDNTTSQRETFMAHTTLSFRELMDGEPLPPLSNLARVKEPMANMFAQRLKDPNSVFAGFIDASIQGMKDIMKQQLNQGPIGDMSRQAKLAASCVKYQGNGVFHIRSTCETIRSVNPQLVDILTDERYPLGGNPCMRAVSAICGVAQQASLDAHRVSQSVESSFDLIHSLIQGGPRSLVVLLPGTPIAAEWTYYTSDAVYAIVDNQSIRSRATSVLGAYSPEVLKAVKLSSMSVQQVCSVGFRVVCTYYGIKLSELEFWAFVELLCYRCEAVAEPITTKQGTIKRDMRWLVSVFSNHYGKLQDFQNRGKTKRFIQPETITDAAATCNFGCL